MLINRIKAAFAAVAVDIKAADHALATHKGSADHDSRYYTKSQIDAQRVWTTETRPDPGVGVFGFNITLGALEYWDGAGWLTVVGNNIYMSSFGLAECGDDDSAFSDFHD